MKQLLNNKLKLLYTNAQREFYKTPIQSSVALGGIIFLLIQIFLFLWMKGNSSNPLINLLSITIKANLSLVILSLLLLLVTLIHLHRKETKFIDYSPTYNFASRWLSIKESEERDNRDNESLSISRKALRNSTWANIIAINAIIIAIMAIVIPLLMRK